MNVGQSLRASLKIVPNVLDDTIATQRQQLKDLMHIADGARASINGDAEIEDMETWAKAARNATDVAKSLRENLEMQTMSRVSVADAPLSRLGDEIMKRIKTGDPEADDARKFILDAAKKLSKKEATRGRS